MYFYYQEKETPKGAERGSAPWKSRESKWREQTIQDLKPPLVTVLDVNVDVDSVAPENLKQLRYAGPFYLDWDAPTIMEAAAGVNEFLDLLEAEYGFNLLQLDIYATGGRGFHVEIPMKCFTDEKDVVALPLVYKELAFLLATDYMDLSVYSTRKGRMWRVPNVQRLNGKYKVPIRVSDIRDMSESLYDRLTSQPQSKLERDIPVPNPDLSTLFKKLKDKVIAANGAKARRAQQDLKKTFGEIPASLLNLYQGTNLKPEAGLNQIALQIAIISHGFGLSLREHLDLAEGLITTHKGDKSKRANGNRNEVVRLYNYIADNPCYVYQEHSVLALLDDDVEVSDLDVTEAKLQAQVTEAALKDLSDLYGQVRVSKVGTHAKDDESVYRIAHVGFSMDDVVVAQGEDGSDEGYHLPYTHNGEPVGALVVTSSNFASPDRVKATYEQAGGVLSQMDQKACQGIYAQIIDHATRNKKDGKLTVKYINREGLKVDNTPDGPVMVWCGSGSGVPNGKPILVDGAKTSCKYLWRSVEGSVNGELKTDLMDATPITDTPLHREVIGSFLRLIYNPATMAQVLGWFSAVVWKEVYSTHYREFPFLYVAGEAGAGKTETFSIMARLYTFREPPKQVTLTGNSTIFGLQTKLQASWTIPVLLDEYKPAQMTPNKLADAKGILHAIFNPFTEHTRGGGRAGSVKSTNWAETHARLYTTPVVVNGETMDDTPAIRDRSIMAWFNAGHKSATRQHYENVAQNLGIISSLGRHICLTTMEHVRDHGVEQILRMFEDERQKARAEIRSRMSDRQMSALAIAAIGLRWLKSCLNRVYQDEFDDRIEQLVAALYDNAQVVQRPDTEMVKALREIAQLTFNEPGKDIRRGIDYVYADDDHIDLAVDSLSFRYQQVGLFAKSHFTGPSQFREALGAWEGTVDRICENSRLKTVPSKVIYRIKVATLNEWGIEPFAK